MKRLCPLSKIAIAGVSAVLVLAQSLLMPSIASAHEAGTSAIAITVTDDTLSAQLDLPVDKLEAALGVELATDRLSLSMSREVLVDYVLDHLLVGPELAAGESSSSGVASSSDAGDAVIPVGDGGWSETVGTTTSVTIDGVEHLRIAVVVDPTGAMPDSWSLYYEGILESDSTHEIYITLTDLDGSTSLVGVLDDTSRVITVGSAHEGEGSATFTGMVERGFVHVLDGADHVLFLLVLLLPAPLALTSGRWIPGSDARASGLRVMHVATAFALGHSMTLIASVLGWISLPTQPVEVLVAASVAVAAVHVVRPLAVGAEVGIAGSFGLVHGLAFSGILDDLGLSRSTSLTSLIGFNVGIEAAQLVVIGVMFPCLWAISRTSAYGAVRTVGAGAALVLSMAWIIDRVGLAANPLAAFEQTMMDNLAWAAVVLVTLTLVGSALNGNALNGNALNGNALNGNEMVGEQVAATMSPEKATVRLVQSRSASPLRKKPLQLEKL